MVAHPPLAALSGRGAALARAALVATAVALFVRTFVLAPALVPSASMAPALLAGDRVLVNRMLYAGPLPAALAPLLPAREPRRGDVVWLRSPEDGVTNLVKRCAAVGGDSFGGRSLSPGELAVLGDRRQDSRDSRHFGPVARAAVTGRVSWVLWSRPRGGAVRWRRILRAVR